MDMVVWVGWWLDGDLVSGCREGRWLKRDIIIRWGGGVCVCRK